MSLRWIAPALAVCLLAGCAVPVRVPTGPAFDPSAGPLLVFLDPLPPDARRLTARLAGIDAVREDGGRVPLRLGDPVLGTQSHPQAYRLATGSLPPGRYVGLDVTAAEATLAKEDGQSDLGLPEGPTRVPLPFTVALGRGTVVYLDLDLKAALADGFRFVPVFGGTIPAPLPIGLVGLASLPDEGLVVTFDRRSGRVSGVTPVGRRPVGIAIDEVRRRAYVALAGEDALVSIDMERGTIANKRPLRGGDQPVDLVLKDDGERLVVANEGSSSIAFVETAGLAEVEERVVVGDYPVAVVVREYPFLRTGSDRWSMQRIFVACRRANIVEELGWDGKEQIWKRMQSLGTDPGPFRLQFNRSSDRLFVAQDGSPYVIVASLFDEKRKPILELAQRPFVGPGQSAIRIESPSDRIYLARRGTGTIEVFDPFSLLAIERLPVPGDVSYLTIDRETAGLVAVVPGKGEVVRVSPVSRSIEAVVPAGPGVAFVALVGER